MVLCKWHMANTVNGKNMPILTDYETKKIIKLKELLPDWWGEHQFK